MQSFKNLLIFFLGLSLAGLIWGISLVFLQKTPLFYVPNYKEYSFYPINLTHIFFNSFEVKIKKSLETLKGVTLKALYYNGKSGFVILQSKNKTVFVDLGKFYKGYKLIKIGINYAIFEKNNKEYKITMKKEKLENTFTVKPSFQIKTMIVSKKTFEKYKNNLKKIWQNIGIVKVKNGYLITYIKPGSIFDKIGLKTGDVLIEVNGRKLKNDADAWNLYKNADNFTQFEIKIKRDNKIKVLNYEMD